MADQVLFAAAEAPFGIFQPGDDRNDTILHQAVKTKDFNLVKEIALSGGHLFINSLNSKSRSPIHIAIEQELDQIVEMFLSTFREKIDDNQDLVHFAIEKGNLKIIELVAVNFSIVKRNQDNMTAFCVAIKKEKFEILDQLLNWCDNASICSDIYNYHALFYVAIIAGNIELIKKYLESNFPINGSIELNPDGWQTLNDHNGFSPLHLAVKYLRQNVVELLLKKGADISLKNKIGSTALHLAFEAKTRGVWKTWQDFETNDKIIDSILDVKLKEHAKLTNSDRVSHLHVACTRDRPEIIENLLQDKSITANDFRTTDDRGFSSLHYAAKYRCHKVAKVLLRYHMPIVNQKDEEFRTPLHVASKETSTEFVQLLMLHGADLTLKDCHGNTPVHLAFNKRNYEVLNLLLADRAITESNPADSVGISHFHIACTRGDANLVKAFIHARWPVNLQVPKSEFKIRYSRRDKDLDWRGCVPLHFATVFNRIKIVELLLLHGADVHRRDARGFTPLHLACQQSYDRFGEMIKAYLLYWRHDSSARNLDWMSVQLRNRPYNDVTYVYEDTETKTSDPYPRRFPTHSSLVDILKLDEVKIINSKLNRRDQLDMIELLLKNGADLNAVDNFGNAPLFYVYDMNIHTILEVMDEKLRLDKRLGTLIVKNLLVEMYYRRRCLLDKIFQLGVRVNIDKSYNNCSILRYICQDNEFCDTDRANMAKYFLRKKANPDATYDSSLSTNLETLVESGNRSTPLHVATRCPNMYNLKIVNHLLEFGANPNAKQSDGTTALHNLSLPETKETSWARQEIARTLLEYGANIDSRDCEGRTPLFVACKNRGNKSIRQLLNRGADVNVEDNNGRTALCDFYENQIVKLGDTRPGMGTVLVIVQLIRHVEELQVVGLQVGEKVVESRLKLYGYLNRVAGIPNDNTYHKVLENKVKKLKDTRVNCRTSLYDIVHMNVQDVSKNVVIEPLEKLLYSTESYAEHVPIYIHCVDRKYKLALERRNLLPKAKVTLNRLLSTSCFPEVCSELIFAGLTNLELEDFIKAYADLTGFVVDRTRVKAYLEIRSVLSKYVTLTVKNEFVVDLIVRRL